ncbi:electron transfer flavoprotein subunit alpha/FixB family protein [Paenibacillus polymyxa]|uniref:Electron transfer flavoprotein subunit alpha/FixB family protein n=1 Tax=Paenibacillus polymyxa TaxID=1406 RepID=A0A8I1LSM0_PAEPO|nr:electron transfer flavoprotein subunit alpha/FixB family protein [Paenibacillus polymyxa]
MPRNKVFFIYDCLDNSVHTELVFARIIHESVPRLAFSCLPEIHVVGPSTLAERFLLEGGGVHIHQVHAVGPTGLEVMSLPRYCHEIYEVIGAIRPDYIFAASSTLGRTITSWLSVQLDTGVVADAIEFRYDEVTEHLVYTRSTDNDSLLSTIAFNRFPEIASVRPKYTELPSLSSLLPIPASRLTANTVSTGTTDGIEVLSRTWLGRTNAYSKVIIGVGRGVSNCALSSIRRFTDHFGIPLMCSRPLVEDQRFPLDLQIGQSGQSIRADLYIAVGISGATQHMLGTAQCKTVVAVNKDPGALIHHYSDISIINDAEKVFSALADMAINRKEATYEASDCSR